MKSGKIKSSIIFSLLAVQAWILTNSFFAAFFAAAIFFAVFARPKNQSQSEIVLEVIGLKVSVALPSGGRRFVLNGVDLKIWAGEVHAIVGSNGSGKSSFARTVLGDPAYFIEFGQISPLKDLTPSERANLGFFVSWQSPVDVPGVTNFVLLHAGENARRRETGDEELSPLSFREICKSRLAEVGAGWLESFLDKSVNEGLSGGERKNVELLALCVLRPRRVVILDEIDSGLDVDAVSAFSQVLGKLRKLTPDLSFILITHHTPLMAVEKVHVMSGGKIYESGGVEILKKINSYGFDKV